MKDIGVETALDDRETLGSHLSNGAYRAYHGFLWWLIGDTSLTY